jgi:hypothetical protein
MRFSLWDDADFLASGLDDVDAFLEGLCSSFGLLHMHGEDFDGDLAIFEVCQVLGCAEMSAVAPFRLAHE